MIVVSDTLPISNLFLAGHLQLLPDVFGKVIVPERVFEELLVLKKDFGHDLSSLKNAAWLEVKAVKSSTILMKMRQTLHEGEAEAIALAKELQADFLLMDEQEGRAFAIAEGLRVVGVLGVLLEAKKQGLVQSVKFVMDELVAKSKFWVSEKVYSQVLQLAGEKEP
jgi:hypothetical protein